MSPARFVKAILAVLFIGPLIAPLFQATQLPLVSDSGALARDLLARYICPTPDKSYVLYGFPMAVCARCWGATIGLWAAWLLIKAQDTGRRTQVAVQSQFAICDLRLVSGYLSMPWPARLLVGALPFLLWVAEISRWPAAPYWLLLLNGALAGFWAGLFFLGLTQKRL